jgi:DNA polymerase-3 subunit epsilon
VAVRDYLLFIDTETSGLPKKWDVPLSQPDNWPYALQISWIIYTREGEKVKEENHYINEDDFTITLSSIKIHGITKDFLLRNGQPRKEIMTLFAHDLTYYQPMVIGHFLELDTDVMGAEFFRVAMDNPIEKLPCFCIMLATTYLVRNPRAKYLRLGDLYQTLFNFPQENKHDALGDVAATAACFFELERRGDINDETIKLQSQPPPIGKPTFTEKFRWGFFIVMVCLLTALIAHWI